MKIGIITIIDNLNYGNRLQNIALDMLIKELGHVPTSGLSCFSKEDWIIRTDSRIKKAIKRIIPFYLYKKHIQHSISQLNLDPLMKKKEQRFRAFNERYIEMFPAVIARNSKQIGKAINESKYDYFIAGSDQVWNPFFEGHTHEFLWFTDKEKRLSFAASVGAERIPSYLIDYYRESINCFKWISVREKSARKLLQTISSRPIDVTLDPTMLIKRDKWMEISRKPRCDLPGQYICAYFLGNTPEAVDKFSMDKGIPIVTLYSRDFPELFVLDPSEFLYVINHAQYVLTDSFHAFVFSLIFNKEFYVFKRQQKGVNGMFFRIEELIERFKLNSRIQNSNSVFEDEPINNTIWDHVGDYFESERVRILGDLDRLLT